MLKYNSFDGKPGFVVTVAVIRTHKLFLHCIEPLMPHTNTIIPSLSDPNSSNDIQDGFLGTEILSVYQTSIPCAQSAQDTM